MGALVDFVGRRFTWLTVLRRGETRRGSLGQSLVVWVCQCDCGTTKEIPARALAAGRTQSCGCLNLEKIRERQTVHGMHGTRAYKDWKSAKERCFNPTSDRFESYGGRGITMDPLWAESFQAFFDHLGDCPEEYTLDRIDVNLNYAPGNCRWATDEEQANNKRGSVHVVWEGKKLTLAQCAATTGRNYQSLHKLYRRLGSITEAVNLARPVKVPLK
jgi:hypothetical protein